MVLRRISSAYAIVSAPFALTIQVAAQCPPEWLSGADRGPSGASPYVYATIPIDPDGAGPQPEMLVAGDMIWSVHGINVNNVAAWDGKRWHSMGGGVWGRVRALAIHDGALIAGGDAVWRWNGQNWTQLEGNRPPAANAIATYDNALVIDGPDGPLKWTGTDWVSLGSKPVGSNALAVFNGRLYAGGEDLQAWDGEKWSLVDGPVWNGLIRALFVHDGELIVGGSFYADGGTGPGNYVARWNGSRWSTLGSGMNMPAVFALGEFDGALVAAGTFTSAGSRTVNRIAVWNGGSGCLWVLD